MEVLMKNFSFYKNKIIKFRNDLKDLELKCNALNKEYKEDLYKVNIDNNLEELKKRLLEFGGEIVSVPSVEEDLIKILDRGQFWEKKWGRIVKIKGAPCQCHRNSCELWENNRNNFNIRICTGYALTEDCIWRQHSWLVFIDERTNKAKIIETTVERIAYYGFVMSEEECEEFCYDNY